MVRGERCVRRFCGKVPSASSPSSLLHQHLERAPAHPMRYCSRIGIVVHVEASAGGGEQIFARVRDAMNLGWGGEGRAECDEFVVCDRRHWKLELQAARTFKPQPPLSSTFAGLSPL